MDSGYTVAISCIECPFTEMFLECCAVPVGIVMEENQRFGQIAIVESLGADYASNYLLRIGSCPDLFV